jgi:hypothetical protein
VPALHRPGARPGTSPWRTASSDGDYIEAGSWAVVGAVTKSTLTVGRQAADLEPIVSVLQRCGSSAASTTPAHGPAIAGRNRRITTDCGRFERPRQLDYRPGDAGDSTLIHD